LNLNDHLSNKSILLIIIRLAKPVYPEKCCLSFTCPGVQDHTTPQAHTSLSQTLWALYIFGIFCILIFNEEYQNAITTVYTMVNGALLSTSASYDLFFGICIHSDSMYYWILMKIKGVAEESWSGTTKEDEESLIPKHHLRKRWTNIWICQQMLVVMVNLGKVDVKLYQCSSDK
jgi:hypothetical protein